jgi:hypothetical protein
MEVRTLYVGDLLLTTLQSMIAVGGPLINGKLALFETAGPSNPGTTLADLQKAQYTGYADQGPIAFATPHLDDGGRAVVFVKPMEFKPTGPGVTSTVFQVGVLNTAGDTLLLIGQLETPINFFGPDDAFLIGFPVILSQPEPTLEEIVP